MGLCTATLPLHTRGRGWRPAQIETDRAFWRQPPFRFVRAQCIRPSAAAVRALRAFPRQSGCVLALPPLARTPPQRWRRAIWLLAGRARLWPERCLRPIRVLVECGVAWGVPHQLSHNLSVVGLQSRSGMILGAQGVHRPSGAESLLGLLLLSILAPFFFFFFLPSLCVSS